jgi:glucose/arabinose dehydrogenase
MPRSPLRLALALTSLSALALASCGGDRQGTSTSATSAQGGTGTGGTQSSGGAAGSGATSGGAAGSGATSGGTAGSGGSGGAMSGGSGGAMSGGSGGATTTSSTGGGPQAGVDCSPPQGAIPNLQLTKIATGFSKPVFVTAAPGDDERLFVVEQSGTIRIVKNGVVQDKPFLDITDRVHTPGGGDERGLLGLAFHPDYVKNGRFFVYYTDNNHENGSTGYQNLVEFARADADTAKSDASGYGVQVEELLSLYDSESNHNGGMVAFGPDGMLYLGLGDGGGGGDQHGSFGNGQNLATMWGKILRLDVSTTPYSIPPGNMTQVPPNNPTQGAVVPEIWDYGLRNPWRFTFDPCTGDLYIGDVGQSAWEEIDIEPKGKGNRNYGWRLLEGSHPYNVENYDTSNVVLPVDEYPHVMGATNIGCSVSGGVVYRASAVPALRGTYFYGDYCSGKIWSFSWDGAAIQNKTDRTADLGQAGNVVSFGQDNQGNVYVVDLAGNIFRIDAE